MKLVDIYRGFADETRLRILQLLARGPLCVCHLQGILGAPQVAVSKHLAYLRQRGLVQARRYENWMIYRLPVPVPPTLDRHLRCLQACVAADRKFREDLRRLRKLRCECEWVSELAGDKGN